MTKMPEWLGILIVLIAFIMIFFFVVAIGIPGIVAKKLSYIVKVIWGSIP